jgi:hypothetical protein
VRNGGWFNGREKKLTKVSPRLTRPAKAPDVKAEMNLMQFM